MGLHHVSRTTSSSASPDDTLSLSKTQTTLAVINLLIRRTNAISQLRQARQHSQRLPRLQIRLRPVLQARTSLQRPQGLDHRHGQHPWTGGLAARRRYAKTKQTLSAISGVKVTVKAKKRLITCTVTYLKPPTAHLEALSFCSQSKSRSDTAGTKPTATISVPAVSCPVPFSTHPSPSLLASLPLPRTDTKTLMTQLVCDDPTLRKEVNMMTPWTEWGAVDDVAKTAVFLASEDAAYVTGVALPVDGGYIAQ